MTETSKQPQLTLIRGGKIDTREFAHLPMQEKLAVLRQQPAKTRLDLLLSDPEGKTITQALQPQELYWIIKDLGETDSLELFELASPEQCTFMLDMELWDKWTFSSEKALKWLAYFVEAGESKLLEQLPHLDFELLLLLLERQITVGGGIGELINDEQRLDNWDHSFDNIFYITFNDPQNARLIGTLLDIIYRNDHLLYQALMTGVQNEIESELEELALQFRTGRLADLGFPSLEEAVSIYSTIDPATFIPADDKILVPTEEATVLPEPYSAGELLFQRALARAYSPALQMELNYLINNALVAEETAFGDNEGMEAVSRRVYGYLNISLEYLSGNDEQKAARLLSGEHLNRLFQLGHSLVAGLSRKGAGLTSDNYATSKALRGLKAVRPNFYRGLDPDMIDGYREFRTLSDVRTVEEFLRALEG